MSRVEVKSAQAMVGSAKLFCRPGRSGGELQRDLSGESLVILLMLPESVPVWEVRIYLESLSLCTSRTACLMSMMITVEQSPAPPLR